MLTLSSGTCTVRKAPGVIFFRMKRKGPHSAPRSQSGLLLGSWAAKASSMARLRRLGISCAVLMTRRFF